MGRGKAYTREQRNRAIAHKFQKLRVWIGEKGALDFCAGNNLGRLSKGKIHCSCWMCRRKSYDDWSHSDTKKRMKDLE